MFHDKDILLRQIEQLAESVLRRLRGLEAAEVEQEVEAATALDLDTALRFPPEMLVTLLSTAEGPDARKLMLLALGLAARGAEDPVVEARARDLAMRAIVLRPSLAEVPGVAALFGEPNG